MGRGFVPIKDHFGRPLKDLRISVIDQCNLRCKYCMPKEIFGDDYPFLPENELLSFDEITRLARIFAQLGVEKIRITGGEPLMRKNLEVLIAELTAIPGIKDIALTTNGIFLPKRAKKLKQAGLKRVNISLDAIDDEVFKLINGRGVVTLPVLKGIEAAQNAGLQIKINMVVKKGMNESQIVDTIHKEMPLEPLDKNYYGEVASRYKYQDGEGEIGVISSVTDSFCGTCTRLRLSADGKLFTCLFASSGFDVREKIRSGLSDEQLTETIAALWARRKDRYSDERAEKRHNRRKKIEMSYIGG